MIKKKTLGVYLATAALALGAAGLSCVAYVQKKDGLHKEVVRFLHPDDDILVCREPKPPMVIARDDPSSSAINLSEYERSSEETSNYGMCIEKYTGESVPRPQPLKFDHEKILGQQQEYLDKKHNKEHLEEVNKTLIEAVKKGNLEIKPVTTINPTTNISPETTISPVISGGQIDPNYVKYFNQQKQAEYSPNISLSLEGQEKICDGKGGSLTRLIGVVKFGECVYNPVDKSSEGIETVIGEMRRVSEKGGIILYCGNASEPLASSCYPEVGDYGNLQLCWDRGRAVADSCEESLSDFIHVVYVNGTKLNERKVEVYLVREDPIIKLMSQEETSPVNPLDELDELGRQKTPPVDSFDETLRLMSQDGEQK